MEGEHVWVCANARLPAGAFRANLIYVPVLAELYTTRRAARDR